MTNAKVITLNAPYLCANRSNTINNPSSGSDLYQSRMADGKSETKTIRTLNGAPSSVIYNVSGGRFYVDVESAVLVIPIKDEFEADDEIETRVASSITPSYDYEMLETGLTGTDKCLIVRSKISKEMVRVST